MRSLSATVRQLAGAVRPRRAAARVAVRSVVAAPALVKTPSSTPLLYSSGPATSLTEYVPSALRVARPAQNRAMPSITGQPRSRSQRVSLVAR